MYLNFVALLKSKIFWANILGVAIAVGAVFNVSPEMTGKTAEYAMMGLSILTIVLRMFSKSSTQILSMKRKSN